MNKQTEKGSAHNVITHISKKSEACTTESLNPVWHDLHNPLASRKATIKAQLLMQQYTLTTSPMAGAKCSDIYPLCNDEQVTTINFLLHFRVLQNTRVPYLHHSMTTCHNNKIAIDPEVLLNTHHSHLKPPPERQDQWRKMLQFYLQDAHWMGYLIGGQYGI